MNLEKLQILLDQMFLAKSDQIFHFEFRKRAFIIEHLPTLDAVHTFCIFVANQKNQFKV